MQIELVSTLSLASVQHTHIASAYLAMDAQDHGHRERPTATSNTEQQKKHGVNKRLHTPGQTRTQMARFMSV